MVEKKVEEKKKELPSDEELEGLIDVEDEEEEDEEVIDEETVKNDTGD